MNDFYLFLLLITGGVFTEVLVFKMYLKFRGRTTKKQFNFIKFTYLLLLPAFAVFLITQRTGLDVLKVFTSFAIVGLILEWCIGFSYEKIMGERLWTYHRYTITKYTSLLSIPLWGLAGIMFWLLARSL